MRKSFSHCKNAESWRAKRGYVALVIPWHTQFLAHERQALDIFLKYSTAAIFKIIKIILCIQNLTKQLLSFVEAKIRFQCPKDQLITVKITLREENHLLITK